MAFFDGIPSTGPGPTSGQLALTQHPNPCHTQACLCSWILNTSVPEILNSKILCYESLIKLQKKYYFEILALKYLKIPVTKIPLLTSPEKIPTFTAFGNMQKYDESMIKDIHTKR